MNLIKPAALALGIGMLLSTVVVAQDVPFAGAPDDELAFDDDFERGPPPGDDRGPRRGPPPRGDREPEFRGEGPDRPFPPPRDGDREPRGPGFRPDGPPPGPGGRGPDGPGPGGPPPVPDGPHGFGGPPHGPGGPGGPHGDWQSLEKKDPEMYKLLQSERELERESHDLAQQYRRAPSDQQSSIREKLEQAVTKHFEARQQRRTLEVKRLEEEVKRLRDSIERRTKSQQAIISDRVSALLGLDAGF